MIYAKEDILKLGDKATNVVKNEDIRKFEDKLENDIYF